MSEKSEEEEDGMSGGEEGREGGLVPFPAVTPSGQPCHERPLPPEHSQGLDLKPPLHLRGGRAQGRVRGGG